MTRTRLVAILIPGSLRSPRFVTALLLGFALMAAGCLSMISRKGWNDSGDRRAISERTFTQDEMAWLRSTTTVFFLPAQDMPFQAQFADALSRAWTLTPIKIAPYEERTNYQDYTKYSYLVIGGENTQVVHLRSHLADDNYTHLYLRLMRFPAKEGGKATSYCRIDLFPDMGTIDRVLKAASADPVANMYAQGKFRNWTPSHLALYLRAAQIDLEASHRRWEFEEYKNERQLAGLKSATLYIPEYALLRFGRFTGDESERHDPRKLLSEYPYKYQIVTAPELERIMAENPDPVFVFDFVRSSADKFVAVYERKAGLVYRTYHSSSYNLDSDDFDWF